MNCRAEARERIFEKWFQILALALMGVGCLLGIAAVGFLFGFTVTFFMGGD